MGTLTDKFSDLSDLLQADALKAHGESKPGAGGRILLDRLIRPLMPAAMRCGPGTVLDVKDREVGLFDLVGCSEAYPPVGEGAATSYLVEGVSFVIQVRDWAVHDLTQFGELTTKLKSLERKAPRPIFCAAVSFSDLSLTEISEFMKSPAGASVDGIVSVGTHVVIRNLQGLYGDVDRVPFVTDRGRGESLKAFSFALVHAAQTSLNIPFGWSAYQHL